jgi:hypothetical protein
VNRNIVLFMLIALLTVAVSACGGGSTTPTIPDQPQDLRTVSYLPDEYCGDATEVCLTAGQNYDAGEVIITNDEDYLYVEIVLNEGWTLVESHVAVADSLDGIPQTKSGNPKVGNFPYDINSFIPLGDWECDTELYVAVHAVVIGPNEYGEDEEQTAWGCGYDFPGHNWATYSMHTIQCCDDGNGKDIPELPTDSVCLNPTVHWGLYSYFDVEFTDVPDGFEWLYEGWDMNGYWLGWCADKLALLDHGVEYCDVMLYSSLEPETFPDDDDFDMDWARVNYILNHKQGDKEDVQDAIWYFGNGIMPPPGPGQDMVEDAMANGGDFYPEEGDWFAVICYVSPDDQLMFIEVDP